MANETNEPVRGAPSARVTRRLPGVVFGSVGAISGAVLGGLAGPAGAIVGAVIGCTMGALSSIAFETASAIRDEHDAKLDRDIGIAEGDIGAPNLPHAPAKIGAPSAASAGVHNSGGSTPSGGPIGPQP